MTFAIAGTNIGVQFPPYIIAEISANHNGSLDRLLASIDAAHQCGVNAIKLQTYTADTMTINCDREDFIVKGGLWNNFKLYDLYKWAETPYEWHKVIFEYAKTKGITLFSTPFDESAVDLLETLNVPAYKIASFEVTDLPLIRYVATTGKPMIISTGLASEEEIEEAVTTASDSGCSQIALLHCVSSYPAPIEQINLKQIPFLGSRFGVISGLSDHTLGLAASVAGVAVGASIIEKHFTISRSDGGPDSGFSLEPNEFTNLCFEVRNAWHALGSANFSRQKSEEASLVFRRSIYFVRDLPAGAVVGPEDIKRIRPGMGLPPKYYDKLIGKRLKIPVVRGTATSWTQFDIKVDIN